MNHRTTTAILLAILIPAASGFATARANHPAAQSGTFANHPDRTVWDSVFTAEQAARGQAVYAQRCARCHQAGLAGDTDNPPLAGKVFLSGWNNMTAADLHDRIYTSMPNDSAGTLSKEQSVDLVAHLFNANGFPAGRKELLVDVDSLSHIRIEARRP